MTKIDDEHIERAATMFCRIMDMPAQHECKAVCNYCLSSAQAILEAALSPKPEPEIEVTPAMAKAGVQAFDACAKFESSVAAMYRAMESTRLKEAAKRERECRACLGTGQDFVHGRHPGPALTCNHCDGTGERKPQEGAAYAAKSAPQGVNAAAPVKETGGGVGLGWRSHERHGDAGFVWHRRKDDTAPDKETESLTGWTPHMRAGEGFIFHRRKDDPA